VRPLLPLTLSAIALALAACGDESDATFDQQGFPFAFEYPHAFEEVDDVNIDSNLGASADQTAAIAIGDDDLILVERFTLNRAIDRSDLGAAKRQFDDLFRQIDPTVSSRASEVAGLPALTIDQVEIPSVEGGQSRFVALLDGDQEYLFNCQSTPDHREEIEQACDMALETLTLDDAAAAG
jgi:hypothetical protein